MNASEMFATSRHPLSTVSACPRVEVGSGGLEQWRARGRHGECFVKIFGLFLADSIGEAEAELLERERNGAVTVKGVAEHRPSGLQRRERKRKNTSEWSGVDGDSCRR